jgi:hypothetical protein
MNMILGMPRSLKMQVDLGRNTMIRVRAVRQECGVDGLPLRYLPTSTV